MYNIPHFKAADEKEVMQFMEAHPFITLCGCDANGKPVATHIPVLIEKRNDALFLKAHVMRNQAHTKAFEQNNNVLAIFSGADTYVSASWYKDKQVASTWNYQAVHASGRISFMDESFLLQLLVELTQKFENNVHSPSLVKNISKEYMAAMMKAIIAFEIEITSIEHIFKLSQNRDEESYENIIHALEENDAGAQIIAEEMKQRKHKVFK